MESNLITNTFALWAYNNFVEEDLRDALEQELKTHLEKQNNSNMKETNYDTSIGESRVRINFNASKSDLVDQLKQGTAVLINTCEAMKVDEGNLGEPEKLRLVNLAMTAYEEAAMWAVKAATFEQ